MEESKWVVRIFSCRETYGEPVTGRSGKRKSPSFGRFIWFGLDLPVRIWGGGAGCAPLTELLGVRGGRNPRWYTTMINWSLFLILPSAL